MEKNNKNNKDNNFRTLDGGSEKQVYINDRNIPDTYVDLLSGYGKFVRSESSYDNTSLIGANEKKGYD